MTKLLLYSLIAVQGFLLLGVGSSGGSAPIAADFFSTAEVADADGTIVTAAIASSGTTVAAGITGTWAISPDPLVQVFVNTTPCGSVQAPQLPKTITIGGTEYTGASSTRAWQRSWAVNATQQSFTRNVTGGTGGTIALFWGWICTTAFLSDGNSGNFDLFEIKGSGGVADDIVLQAVDASGTANDGFRAHTSSGDSGTTIKPVSNSTWYFFTGVLNFPAGTADIQMYTQASLLTRTPIGSITSSVTPNSGNTINGIWFGPENQTVAAYAATSTWLDNVVVDLNATAANFPEGF